MSEITDRRRSSRIACDLSVEYKFRGGRIREARMINIGTSGMLLTVRGAVPPVGADLLFRFRLPRTTRSIKAVGSVRWASVGRAGVEFIRLNPQEQNEIQTYCARELARQRKTNTSEHPLG